MVHDSPERALERSDMSDCFYSLEMSLRRSSFDRLLYLFGTHKYHMLFKDLSNEENQ